MLQSFGKIVERLIFNAIFFSTNNVFSKNQSGLQPDDSYINQLLLSITHDIFTSLDNVLEVRSYIYPQLFITSGERLFFKLKENGISGKLLHILSDFLRNRKQRTELNGRNSL